MIPVLDAFSYGGGVQSNGALVLAAEGEIDCRLFIFSNVGEDSENPDTLTYVENIAKPYAAAHGIEFVEVRRKKTIRQQVVGDNRDIPIPMYLASGAPGNRKCTLRWKSERIQTYLRRTWGFTKQSPALVGIGFSLDEFHRMKTDKPGMVQKLSYPLIDLRLTRRDCIQIIKDAGLPIPPKSSCFFCPFHSPAHWARLRAEHPDLYADAVYIEKKVNEKRKNIGRDTMYMHRYMVPLDVIGDQMMLDLPDDEEYYCQSGVCFV